MYTIIMNQFSPNENIPHRYKAHIYTKMYMYTLVLHVLYHGTNY